MSVGPFQLLIIALVLLLLFGRGRISNTLGDVGRGVRNFRRGLEPDDEPLAVDGPSADDAVSNPADK